MSFQLVHSFATLKELQDHIATGPVIGPVATTATPGGEPVKRGPGRPPGPGKLATPAADSGQGSLF